MAKNSLHLPLRPSARDSTQARTAIGEIVADALANFDQANFWPAHPREDGLPDGTASFYLGATGVIWALEYLRRVGATKSSFGFGPALPRLVQHDHVEFARHAYSA